MGEGVAPLSISICFAECPSVLSLEVEVLFGVADLRLDGFGRSPNDLAIGAVCNLRDCQRVVNAIFLTASSFGHCYLVCGGGGGQLGVCLFLMCTQIGGKLGIKCEWVRSIIFLWLLVHD